MATYTSSQSGNFSSSSTWGNAGVPGDGDRFDSDFISVTGDPVVEKTFDVDPGTYLVVLEVDDGNDNSEKNYATIIVE